MPNLSLSVIPVKLVLEGINRGTGIQCFQYVLDTAGVYPVPDTGRV